jgi:DNA repair protein RadD
MIFKIPELYPHQSEAVDLIEGKFRSGKKAVLYVLPGGGGKTTVAGYMIYKAEKKGTRCLFKAHRRELIKQAQKRLLQFGIHAGMIMSGEKPNEFVLVQVASVQTLSRRNLPACKFIVVDEAHRSLGKQYLEILNYYKSNGSFIVGLTGTPFRTNKRERLADFWDDFVSNATASWLIANDFICGSKVYGSGKISSKGMKSKAGEFREDELMKAFDTENAYTNMVANFLKYAKDKKTIGFGCSVGHSIKCTEALINAGIKAAHIDGNTPEKERDRLIKAFGDGEIQVLFNYGILSEGFDVPDCEAVLLALATKSRIKYLQACWRACRKFPGKKFYIVIDMADNCERFGFPDEDIEVSLEAEDDTESSGVAPVKVCPTCSYMNHASCMCCPDCKHEFKKDQKKIDEEEFIELKRDKKERQWKKYKQKDWYKVKDEDLEAFGKIKDFKPSWAKMELANRKANKKRVKIKDFEGEQKDYYKMVKELEDAYNNKKAIDATKFIFVEENKAYVVFQQVKKKEVENVNDNETII